MLALGEEPPPVKRFREGLFNTSLSVKAIETAKKALPYITFGPPIIRYGPGGEVSVDVPLIYQGFAIDRMHYDVTLKSPSPKGRPPRAVGVKVSREEVVKNVSGIIKELRVIDAAEYRDPEQAWAVPIAWRSIIVAHIKINYSGDSVVPDYGLTEELRRRVI